MAKHSSSVILAAAIAFFSLCTCVLSVISLATTQWLDYTGTLFFRKSLRATASVTANIHAGLWRACESITTPAGTASACANITDGPSKFQATRAMAILIVVFSFIAIFLGLALFSSVKKFRIPNIILTFLAMGSGICAVAVCASFVNDGLDTLPPSPTTPSLNDVLSWSYWLMVAATVLGGIAFILSIFTFIDMDAKPKRASEDIEQPSTPSVVEAPASSAEVQMD